MEFKRINSPFCKADILIHILGSKFLDPHNVLVFTVNLDKILVTRIYA